MDVLDISRWQFGITTVYDFLFVPSCRSRSAWPSWWPVTAGCHNGILTVSIGLKNNE